MKMPAPVLHRRVRARGFSMIEVLITLVVVAFGLLGLSSFVTRATAMSVEAGQRARAAALVEDMQFRVASNKLNLASYATGVTQGAAVADCTVPVTLAQRDLCQWNNLLVGTHEALGAGATAQALTFRGCITQADPAQPVIVITVAWAAMVPGIPPADDCAAGTFGDDSFRRILRSQVRVAALAA
jgi:type IV pilus assembly protein PilV